MRVTLRTLTMALGLSLLGASGMAEAAMAQSGGTARVPLAHVPLARDITLEIPGNSQLAGVAVGIDSVRVLLRTMGLDTPDAPLRWEQFTLSDDEQVWLITPSGNAARRTAPLLLVAESDALRDVIAMRLIPHDQAAFDRQHARDDGILRTSLAAQRNRRQVLALHAGNGVVRFAGAHANDAWVVVKDDVGSHPALLLLHYRFDASGYLIDVRRSRSTVTAHAVVWGTP